mmetsp:Transcript_70069/g.121289  ORF Transcript_70069/g.121289 Transcript_70069/m.121289 type:complete len:418 (-) Transcript_70069:371-1624(-)
MAVVGGCLTAAWRTQLSTRTAAVALVRILGRDSRSAMLPICASSVRSCTATAWSPLRHQVLRSSQAASTSSGLEVMHSRSLGNLAREVNSDVILPITVRGKSTVAVRPTRDPERPKRPISAWIRYLAYFRQSESAGKGNKEVMTAASAKWKALPASERRRWEEPYEVEKKEYEKQMKVYIDSGKRDAWKRDPEKPKVPMTGFLRFAGEYRMKHKDLKITEATKTASAVWKAMSSTQKAPYEKQYVEAKAKYATALKDYKDSGKEAAWEKKVGITAAKEKLEAAKNKVKEAAAKKKEAAAAKKKAAAEKKKAVAAKKKAAAAKKKEAAAKKKEAAAAKKKAIAAKKKEAAAKKKEAAAKKTEAAAAKKKAAAAKEKAAAAKVKAEAKKKAEASAQKTKVASAMKMAPPAAKAPPPPPR